jgi:Flp pilus assembly protein TadD
MFYLILNFGEIRYIVTYSQWSIMRVLACGLMVSILLLAQSAHAGVSAQRSALYQSLLRQPNSLVLNQQYANLCITENDFEAAIPPLERLAILQPSNVLLRLRLGEMFKALGSDVMARKYFLEALNHPRASAEITSKARGYLQ